MKWCSLAVVCLFAVEARAQSATPATPVDTPPAASSTTSGVYTEAQAARGKDVYAGSCRSCHSPQSHTGQMFETWWRGKPLSELFTFVATQMPKNDPGSLAPEEAADVVAYLLQMNAMPAGRRELYPHADSLKHYRIEMKRQDSTATRKQP